MARKFATPKVTAPDPATVGRRFAVPKPVVPDDDGATAEDATPWWEERNDVAPLPGMEYCGRRLAPAEDGVQRWTCRYCDGVVREDGLSVHKYDCRYWADNPSATPF